MDLDASALSACHGACHGACHKGFAPPSSVLVESAHAQAMKRITLPFLLALLVPALAGLRAADSKPPKPNLVIFLADDSGWGDYSINGNTSLRTPNIDSLARVGAVLDRFFVCSVCAPTRAEFLTGRYHARGGVRGVSTGQERLNTDEKTLADTLKAGGYATGAFGKWHNGSQWPYHPNARGFDEYYGFTSGHWGEYFNPPLYLNQDTIARPPAESQMKEFRALKLGVMRLEQGRGLLTLRALKIPGRNIMDVRQVNLTLRGAP